MIKVMVGIQDQLKLSTEVHEVFIYVRRWPHGGPVWKHAIKFPCVVDRTMIFENVPIPELTDIVPHYNAK